MKVTFKVIGKDTAQMDVAPEDTILIIKHRLELMIDAKASHQTFIFKGRILENESRIENCGLVERSIIIVRVKDPNYTPPEEGIVLDPLGIGETDYTSKTDDDKEKLPPPPKILKKSETKEDEQDQGNANPFAPAFPFGPFPFANRPQRNIRPMPIYQPPRRHQQRDQPVLQDILNLPEEREVQISEEEFAKRLKELVDEMGFNQKAATTALRSTNGNTEEAIDVLITQASVGVIDNVEDDQEVNNAGERNRRNRDKAIFVIINQTADENKKGEEERKEKKEEKEEKEKNDEKEEKEEKPEKSEKPEKPEADDEPIFKRTNAGTEIRVTKEDKEQIDQLVSLAEVQPLRAAEAYFACGKSIEDAVNFLFS
ncbi:uncharacterized protein MONOS_7529 [Monocercomonoides exilis]|uniref:uncharacterized protein n=1 Tax=Monocercomonoides exilis TaxID=2049356 RepID=UPI00355AA7E8|nr:hypothetical protein MONOS_7529 [Monocercomonoides exilis]|eukprot:MONOS_7529.1-p1 / transcript=MONOS_7529.1 / gene=MONOS_7529 / organism=Monocercomonoides_exilis_PA203 / gene_product=unspecified product / transcript_product=unspecified product / location=Mono_scaffold00259:50801-52058(+) / protein_length=369 / sequence_SO=supercontig / SO=protein_coding / is_pseudo=false